MKNKRVIILRGISGAGKSTYIERNFPTAFTCSADHFFYNDKEEYNFDPKLLNKAHETCKRNFYDALAQGETPIIVDNTNTKFWEMKPYIEAAKKFNYDVEFVRLDTPVSVAAKRNTHGVPVDVVQKMSDRMEELPEPLRDHEKVIRFDKTRQK